MTVRQFPWITILIILANTIVFMSTWPEIRSGRDQIRMLVGELQLFEDLHPGMNREDFARLADLRAYTMLIARYKQAKRNYCLSNWGFTPAQPRWQELITSLFLHSGWMHLIANMYFLWLCGCSIENLWGRPIYSLTYVTGGMAAGLICAAAFPESTLPLVGASGAIAALIGVFFVRCFNTRIRFVIFLFSNLKTFFVHAWIILGLWLGSQIVNAILYNDTSPVAFWAHIGGLTFGAIVALFIKFTLVEEAFLKAIHRAKSPTQ